jgi:uracil-DNA glycosylase family 4
MKTVPNEHPHFTQTAYRLAVVGEAPGVEEETTGRPFVGTSGRFLWALAGKHGISRDHCFVGNVCQHRPPGNDISHFALDGPEITAGVNQLNADLAAFKPNLVLCLGGTALWWSLGRKDSITHYRGSVYASQHGYKCLPTLHPAMVLREYSGCPLLSFDLRKARTEAASPNLHTVDRNIRVDLSLDEICATFDEWRLRRTPLWTDIEGYWNNISCMGFATDPYNAIVVPFHWPTLEEECRFMRAITGLLTDPAVPKYFQNGLYDLFCLQYGYKIPVRGFVGDNMLQHWELLRATQVPLVPSVPLCTRLRLLERRT